MPSARTPTHACGAEIPPKPGEGLSLQLGLRCDAVAGTGAWGRPPADSVPSFPAPSPPAGPDRIHHRVAPPGPGSLRREIHSEAQILFAA